MFHGRFEVEWMSQEVTYEQRGMVRKKSESVQQRMTRMRNIKVIERVE